MPLTLNQPKLSDSIHNRKTKFNMSSNHKTFVQILSMFFGFGSWIAMTGLWVELPLLTQKLPEGWSLGSFLTVMIQLANIGPLIYWYARVHKLCSEQTAIHLQMGMGTIACLTLIFWWDTTAVIFGKERSIVLYLAAFGLSIVDCTSSVAFLPYMARFKAHHMTPYLIGEGLSGFLPSLVALAQGVTDSGESTSCNAEKRVNESTSTILHDLDLDHGPQIGQILEPRFSANVFFCFLLLILLLSWIAFVLMDILVICRDERIDLTEDSEPSEEYVEFEGPEFIKKELEVNDLCKDVKDQKSYKVKYIWLLGLMCWGCFTTFGAMPSLQSYSCLPYGAETFFYAVTLAGLAYPAACVFGLFVDSRSPKLINSLTLFGSTIGVYILICGILSPYPPLKTEVSGSLIMVVSWTSYIGIISYVKTMVSLELNDVGGNQAMFWCGFAQQAGAASGGALIFIIINFTNVFKEEEKICVES